jgi:hypothetical protein
MRENGFYWAKNELGDWEPAYWTGLFWVRCLVAEVVDLKYFAEFGPRLDPPSQPETTVIVWHGGSSSNRPKKENHILTGLIESEKRTH